MKIIIVGARFDGHANVVLEILKTMNKFEIVGFIDDNPLKVGHQHKGIPVIGNTFELQALKNKHNIIGGIVAVGENKIRRSLAEKVQLAGMVLVNAIHPSVIIDSDVIIGNGNYFGQGVIIVSGSKIGNCVNIHTGATIDHDNIVEDGSNLGPGVHTAGRVYIKQNAMIGTGANLIPDVVIGENSIIGAGAVITRNIPDNVTAVGIPAKIIKTNP